MITITEAISEYQPGEGMKFDDGKLRLDLLPVRSLEAMAAVLTHGAKKYADWNWRKVVQDNPDRYYAAALRHILKRRKGEISDPESGLDHYAHAICCLIFLMEEGNEGDY